MIRQCESATSMPRAVATSQRSTMNRSVRISADFTPIVLHRMRRVRRVALSEAERETIGRIEVFTDCRLNYRLLDDWQRILRIP